MIIKDLGVQNLGQYDGVNVYIKKAINRNSFDEYIEVVTGIKFIDLEGNIIYKKVNYNTYICPFDDKRVFNLMDIINDLVLFVDKSDMENYWKSKIIDNVLSNNYSGLNTIKMFKIDYYKEVERKIKEKEVEQIEKEIEEIKKEVEKVFNIINSYETMRKIQPNENNNYNYEFCTKYTLKRFKSGLYPSDELQVQKDILIHLEAYLNYLRRDFDPKYFLIFDKVI